MKVRLAALLLFLVLAAGCYHATIETGLPPSNQVIKKTFASSWVYGLVPPSTVETMAKCPDGVAMVETQLSFVNQLVGFLTAGIYTPMEITVTCAEKSRAELMEEGAGVLVAEDSSPSAVRDAFALAAREAVSTRGPVFVILGE